MRFPPLQISPDTNTQARGLWNTVTFRDFTGGENKYILPEFMGENQLVTGKNCVIGAEGVPETRKGKTLRSAVELGTSGFTSLHRYSTEGGDHYVVAQQGTGLYAAEWNGTGDIPDFGTAINTLTSSNILRSVVWKDMLIMTNGADAPFRVDSTLVCTNLGGTPVDSHIIKVYGGRLWLVDVTRPNVLCPSELEDYDNWDALDEIKVRDGDGDTIMNLSPQAGGMVILKSRSVWTLYGTSRDSWSLTTTPIYTEGLIGRDAIVDEGVFMGQSGFYRYDLASVSPVFSSHKPTIIGLTQAQKEATKAVTDILNKRVLFHLGNGNTLCIQEQERANAPERYYAITTWEGLNASCFVVANDKDDPCLLLIGDEDAGNIYSLDNENDDAGTAIETLIQFPFNDFGTPNDKVWVLFWLTIMFIGNDADPSFQFGYDIGYNDVVWQEASIGIEQLVWDVGNWDEENWASSEGRAYKKIWFEGIGREISFAVKTSQRIKILDYTTKFRMKEAA